MRVFPRVLRDAAGIACVFALTVFLGQLATANRAFADQDATSSWGAGANREAAEEWAPVRTEGSPEAATAECILKALAASTSLEQCEAFAGGLQDYLDKLCDELKNLGLKGECPVDPWQMWDELLKHLDKSNDGKLSAEELQKLIEKITPWLVTPGAIKQNLQKLCPLDQRYFYKYLGVFCRDYGGKTPPKICASATRKQCERAAYEKCCTEPGKLKKLPDGSTNCQGQMTPEQRRERVIDCPNREGDKWGCFYLP